MIRASSGSIELCKWLALGCMVLDHVNAVFFARELGVLAEFLGRLAFPLFALVLGYNAARPGADLVRLVHRLVIFGAIATPAYWYLFGLVYWWPLNVLFAFALAVACIWLVQDRRPGLAAFLGFLGGFLVEYWWPGVAVVVSAWWFFSGRSSLRLVPLLLAFGWLCLANGNAWALASIPVFLAASWFAPWLPRSPRLFWWFYPAHLAAIALFALWA